MLEPEVENKSLQPETSGILTPFDEDETTDIWSGTTRTHGQMAVSAIADKGGASGSFQWFGDPKGSVVWC